MIRLTFALDALAGQWDASGSPICDASAAAILADLAGVDAVRLGVSDESLQLTEPVIRDLRASARRLELRVAPTQGMLKLALDVRPDLVILCSDAWEGTGRATPMDLRARDVALAPIVRTLEEAGVSVGLLIAAETESVKNAHSLGIESIELFTGTTVDLPERERRPQLERLGDAARLAAKLRLGIGLAGGIDFRLVREVLEAAPACSRVVIGRALAGRSMLVGIDRAVRDFRALLL